MYVVEVIFQTCASVEIVLQWSSRGSQNISLPSSAKWSFMACYPEGGLICHLVLERFHFWLFVRIKKPGGSSSIVLNFLADSLVGERFERGLHKIRYLYRWIRNPLFGRAPPFGIFLSVIGYLVVRKLRAPRISLEPFLPNYYRAFWLVLDVCAGENIRHLHFWLELNDKTIFLVLPILYLPSVSGAVWWSSDSIDTQCWRPHPSSRLFGSGYSSDITADGPEAVNLVQSRISLERLETKKEERKTVLAPSSLLLKSPRVIDLKHGILVREADSIVGLSLDPIAVRMVFLQLADSPCSDKSSLESILMHLPLISPSLHVYDISPAHSWIDDIDVLLDATHAGGISQFPLRSKSLMRIKELVLSAPDLEGNTLDVACLDSYIESLCRCTQHLGPRLDLQTLFDVLARIGIESCMLAGVISDGRGSSAQITQSSLNVLKVMPHGSRFTLAQLRFLMATLRVGVGLYEGEVFSHPLKDLSPSLERSLELLFRVILSQFSKMGSMRGPEHGISMLPSSRLMSALRAEAEQVKEQRPDVWSLGLGFFENIVSTSMDSSPWITCARKLSISESAMVLDSLSHPLAILHAIWTRADTREAFLSSQRIELEENWRSLRTMIGVLEAATMGLGILQRRSTGIQVLVTIRKGGSTPINTPLFRKGFNVECALSCLRLLYNLFVWRIDSPADWDIEGIFKIVEAPFPFRARARVVHVAVFRDTIIPLQAPDIQITRQWRENTLNRIAKIMWECRSSPSDFRFPSLDSRELSMESLCSQGVSDGAFRILVDYRPRHPSNPFLVEFDLPPQRSQSTTRSGRKVIPDRFRSIPAHLAPPGKHYTMPSDPFASRYMYFAPRQCCSFDK